MYCYGSNISYCHTCPRWASSQTWKQSCAVAPERTCGKAESTCKHSRNIDRRGSKSHRHKGPTNAIVPTREKTGMSAWEPGTYLLFGDARLEVLRVKSHFVFSVHSSSQNKSYCAWRVTGNLFPWTTRKKKNWNPRKRTWEPFVVLFGTMPRPWI